MLNQTKIRDSKLDAIKLAECLIELQPQEISEADLHSLHHFYSQHKYAVNKKLYLDKINALIFNIGRHKITQILEQNNRSPSDDLF